jgi:ubiquinone/menaquinone biosynthesis C-methylase UbiE
MIQRLDVPDAAKAVAQYRQHAGDYDASAQRTMRLRVRTIEKLGLRPGDRVLDVACGTGLSFPLLREAVGAHGAVIGIDVSPDMMDLARRRVVHAGWQNVTLLEAPVDSAGIPGPLDAVLFNFTHDVMRSTAALARIFAATAPGARVAIAGMKYLPWWMAPLNVVVRAKARPYMTTFEGLEAPWNLTLPYLSGFRWTPALFGIAYIGWGRVREVENA